MTIPDPLLDVPDVAAYLKKKNLQWVRDHARELGGIKVGNLWRFDLADVQRYLDRRSHRDPLALTPLSAKRQAAKRQAAKQRRAS